MSEFIRGFPVTIIDCTAAIGADLICRLFLFFQIIVQMAHTGHDPVIKCITYIDINMLFRAFNYSVAQHLKRHLKNNEAYKPV